MQEAVEAIRGAHNKLHEAEIMLIEATSDFEILRDRNSSVQELLEDQRRQVDLLATETETAQRRAKAVLEKCSQLLVGVEEELRSFLGRLPASQTTEQLEDEIESEKARLELMHEGNGGVIREYEQRKKKIDALAARLEEIKNASSELDDKIKELRDQWEPELDSLVGKISNSFSLNMEQISCAGEVGIHKDEDFDQWAIQIRVKFRYTLSSPFLSALKQTLATDSHHQRIRAPNDPRLPPPIRRRTRRQHNLLPHVPAIPNPLSLPRRRRNKPRHGPTQRTPRPQTHGRHRLRHARRRASAIPTTRKRPQ